MRIGARSRRCQRVGTRARSGTLWRPTLPWRRDLGRRGHAVSWCVSLSGFLWWACVLGVVVSQPSPGEQRCQLGRPGSSLALWMACPAVRCAVLCCRRRCRRFHGRSDKARIRDGHCRWWWWWCSARGGRWLCDAAGECLAVGAAVVVGAVGDYYGDASELGCGGWKGGKKWCRDGWRGDGEEMAGTGWRFQAQRGRTTTTTTRPTTMDDRRDSSSGRSRGGAPLRSRGGKGWMDGWMWMAARACE